MRNRKVIGIFALVVVLVMSLLPLATVTATDDSIKPIIFVHGGAGSAQQFDSQAMRFASNGWPVDLMFAFEYDSTFATQDLATVIARLDAFIDSVQEQTGADKIYLMGHSLGTTVSHTYLADTSSCGEGCQICEYRWPYSGSAPRRCTYPGYMGPIRRNGSSQSASPDSRGNERSSSRPVSCPIGNLR